MGKVISLLERRMAKNAAKEATKIIDKEASDLTEQAAKKMLKNGEVPFTAADQSVVKTIQDVSDKKFKFTRYSGTTQKIKNPISSDFSNAFDAEMKNVSPGSGAVDDALKNLQKGDHSANASKFSNMIDNAKSFRQSVKNGNVSFDAGKVAPKPKNALLEKGGNFMRQAVPIAVGGGLVFSMFNRGGQMSNSELYGQQQSYGGGY